jgi:hypothetical protein
MSGGISSFTDHHWTALLHPWMGFGLYPVLRKGRGRCLPEFELDSKFLNDRATSRWPQETEKSAALPDFTYDHIQNA